MSPKGSSIFRTLFALLTVPNSGIPSNFLGNGAFDGLEISAVSGTSKVATAGGVVERGSFFGSSDASAPSPFSIFTGLALFSADRPFFIFLSGGGERSGEGEPGGKGEDGDADLIPPSLLPFSSLISFLMYSVLP